MQECSGGTPASIDVQQLTSTWYGRESNSGAKSSAYFEVPRCSLTRIPPASAFSRVRCGARAGNHRGAGGSGMAEARTARHPNCCPPVPGADLKPHLVRGWLTRPADPQFFDKAADVCAVYRTRPPNAVVLSVDEKTGITARSRKHPDAPARPGQLVRREFEYVRHGTVSIIAALEVHTGQVLTQTIARNDSGTFIRFLRLLDSSIPAGLDIHLVMDNGSSHTSRKTGAWLGLAPPVPHPPHPKTRLVAKPSGDLLLHAHPAGVAPRPVRLP